MKTERNDTFPLRNKKEFFFRILDHLINSMFIFKEGKRLKKKDKRKIQRNIF